MKNLGKYGLIVVSIIGMFVAGVIGLRCSATKKSDDVPIGTDTTDEIRNVDLTKIINRDKIQFNAVMKHVRGRIDTTSDIAQLHDVEIPADTTSDSSRRNSVAGIRRFDRYEFDTVINRDTMRFEFVPLSQTLYFDRLPFADTAHFKFSDTVKTITIRTSVPRPWYEVPAYIGGGLIVGFGIGLLTGVLK
jgi:hypothetical protein